MAPKARTGFKHLIRRRAGGYCERCGHRISKKINHERSGSVHHRLPRRFGGPDVPQNALLLCLRCHREVHQDEDAAARKGWIVWLDPAVTPVLLRHQQWALLDEWGGWSPMSKPEAKEVLAWLHAVVLAIQPDRLTPVGGGH